MLDEMYTYGKGGNDHSRYTYNESDSNPSNIYSDSQFKSAGTARFSIRVILTIGVLKISRCVSVCRCGIVLMWILKSEMKVMRKGREAILREAILL